MKPLRIGTRGSPLALKQTDIVVQNLAAVGYNNVKVISIKTTGCRITDRPLYEVGGKGLFTKEIHEALEQDYIDCAVHSLKDMEGTLALEMFPAVLERADPRDILISKTGVALQDLPKGARVGTSSPRRSATISYLRPDLEILPIRGNIQTRIDQVLSGKFEATLLAKAGLDRLGLSHYITEVFPTDVFLPAASQGVIGIQILPHREDLRALFTPLNHFPTWKCTLAERLTLQKIQGDCRTAVSIYAQPLEENLLSLEARLWTSGGLYSARATGESPLDLSHRVLKEMKECLTF